MAHSRPRDRLAAIPENSVTPAASTVAGEHVADIGVLSRETREKMVDRRVDPIEFTDQRGPLGLVRHGSVFDLESQPRERGSELVGDIHAEPAFACQCLVDLP